MGGPGSAQGPRSAEGVRVGPGARRPGGVQAMGIRSFPTDLLNMWALDTLSAISYMHDSLGFVHRDIKLANVLFREERLLDPPTLPLCAGLRPSAHPGGYVA